jgi:hypothetical protein
MSRKCAPHGSTERSLTPMTPALLDQPSQSAFRRRRPSANLLTVISGMAVMRSVACSRPTMRFCDIASTVTGAGEKPRSLNVRLI